MTPGQPLNLRSILNIYSKWFALTNPSPLLGSLWAGLAGPPSSYNIDIHIFLMACLHWVSEISVDTVITDVRGRNTGVDSIWCLVLVETGLDQMWQIALVWRLIRCCSEFQQYLREDGEWSRSTLARLIIDSFSIILHQPKHYSPVSALTLMHVIGVNLRSHGHSSSPSPPGLHWSKNTHSFVLARRQKVVFSQ